MEVINIKNENEITVRVNCSKEEFINYLIDKGFKKGRKFSLDDYYFIPKKLQIEKLTTREILKYAVIIRDIIDDGKIIKKIEFKKKDIDEKGDIVNQSKISLDILNIDDAKRLFESIGYYEIMNIKEKDAAFYKDDFELALKMLKENEILIEIETRENTKYDTIEKIQKYIDELNLPIDKDSYFVKKAENELNRLLNR